MKRLIELVILSITFLVIFLAAWVIIIENAEAAPRGYSYFNSEITLPNGEKLIRTWQVEDDSMYRFLDMCWDVYPQWLINPAHDAPPDEVIRAPLLWVHQFRSIMDWGQVQKTNLRTRVQEWDEGEPLPESFGWEPLSEPPQE